MVISSSADVFFQQNMYANYGERSECWDWSLLLYTELTIRLLGTRYCSRRLGSRCQEACWWFSGDDLGRQFSALDSCLCRNLAMSLASINFLKHFHTFLTGCVQDEQAHWLDRGHAKIRRKFPRVPSSVWQRVKTCGSHEWGKCGVKMWHNTLFLSLNILVSFHRWDPSQSLAGSSAKTPSWPFLKLSKKYHAGMMRCGFLKPYTTFPPHPCWRWTVYHRSDKLFAYNSVMDQLADAQVTWNLFFFVWTSLTLRLNNTICFAECDQVKPIECLKLVLLFTLRYEKDGTRLVGYHTTCASIDRSWDAFLDAHQVDNMVAALSRRNIEPSHLRLVKDIVEVSVWDSSRFSLASTSDHFLNSHHSYRLPARTVELGAFQVVNDAVNNFGREIRKTYPVFPELVSQFNSWFRFNNPHTVTFLETETFSPVLLKL